MILRSLPVAIVMACGWCGCAPLGPRFNPRTNPEKPKSSVPLAFQPMPGHPVPEGLLLPPKEPFRLGSGDRLEIEILQLAGTRQNCLIMPDGTLYYQALPGIPASGLTLLELKARLETALRQDYRDPQVSIILRGVRSRKIWVLGRVNTPGLYPLENPTTVLEAIARAGGLFASRMSGTTEELADLHHSFLVRNGAFLPVDFYKLLREGDLSQNIYLHDGDYIYLPSSLSEEVYVLGAVKQPMTVGFSDQVTLVSAIANARGLLPTAYPQRVVIIRGSLTRPAVAVVNFNSILAAKEPDIRLEPRDIVWVPNGPWERLERYTKLVIDTFVRTVAANEGGRAAVGSSATAVQSNITINPATPAATSH